MIDRKRPAAVCFPHRRLLLLMTTFTLMIFPLSSRADNSNYNDDLDASSTPEMAPIEDAATGENTGSFGVEGREELPETRNILTPSVAAEAEHGYEDTPVVDETAGGAAAADTGTAGPTDTAESSESGNPQQSQAVPVAGEEGDDSTAAGRTTLEVEGGTPVTALGIADEGNDTGQQEISQEQEAEERRDDKVQASETKGGGDEEKLPTVDDDGEDTVGSGHIVTDGHHDAAEGEVILASGTQKLSAPAAVTADDDQVDSSDHITRIAEGDAQPADAIAAAAAAASSDGNEEQQQQQQQQQQRQQRQRQQQQRSSMPSGTSDNGSLLDARASATTTAAGATQAKDSAVATTEAGDGDLGVSGGSSSSSSSSSSSDDDGEDGTDAVDDTAAESGTSYVSSIADPAAPGGGEPQEPVRPAGPRSPKGSIPGAASDVEDARPSHADGSQDGAEGGIDEGEDGDDGDDGDGGVVDDDTTTADRARADSTTGRLPEITDEGEAETAPSNRSRSGGGGGGSGSSRSGWNEGGGHERHKGGEGQGVSGKAGGGEEKEEGAYRRDQGGGRRDGGASGGAEFPRGSPEELAQRVRDMEAELVRKLLAEEDAKSLLDM